MTGTTPRRPTGITILAILATTNGAFSLLTGIGFIAGGPVLAEIAVGPEASATADAIKTVATVLGVAWLIIGAAQLAFAFGAWTLKPWGRPVGILIEGASIVLTFVIGVWAGSLVDTLIASTIPLAIAILIIWYLNTPGVKAAFAQPGAG